jgi:outer membrane protein OmpA-like peptidoglycan-associated protein
MDAQEEELKRDLRTATIERKGDQLVVKFQSAILFDVDQAALKSQSQRELADLARVLKDYPDTTLIIEGHTDSSGSAEHNRRLSEARAQSVIDYVASAGVDRHRLTRRGLGEDRPLASNATPEGRAQNRRVEVHIAPNEDLRRADAANAKSRS